MITPNPVWVRESRAYWRGWRAFALLLLYSGILVGSLVWGYNDFINSNLRWNDNPTLLSARLGHSLFMMLTWMQVVGWMLIGPVLSASSIAGERERGLLESLYLSRLSPARIVAGKMLSSLSMVLLMIVVMLPITATCLMLGGVSPGEVFWAFVLHACTATACVSLGLACSAWFRRPGTAIAGAIAGALIWGFGGSVCLAVLSIFQPMGLFRSPQLTIYLFFSINPVMAAVTIVEPGIITGPGMTGMSPGHLLAICLTFEMLVTVFMLRLAVRGVRKPLPDAVYIELKKRKPRRHPMVVQTGRAADPNPAASPTAGTPMESPQPSGEEAAREISLAPSLNFANPILQREVRLRLRLRKASKWTFVLLAFLIPGAIYAYTRAIWWMLTDRFARESVGPPVLVMLMVAVVCLCPLFGACAITRERETGTWEALCISLLSPIQILWGKLCSPLVVCGLLTLSMLPLLLPCIAKLSYDPDGEGGLSVTQVLASGVLFVCVACCYTLWGMLFSWWCKKTTVAIAWTMGTLLLVLLFLPALISMSRAYGSEAGFMWWHPVFAVASVVTSRRPYQADLFTSMGHVTLFVTVIYSIASVILFSLLRAMLENGARERDPRLMPSSGKGHATVDNSVDATARNPV